jgi:hypothetical protein
VGFSHKLAIHIVYAFTEISHQIHCISY